MASIVPQEKGDRCYITMYTTLAPITRDEIIAYLGLEILTPVSSSTDILRLIASYTDEVQMHEWHTQILGEYVLEVPYGVHQVYTRCGYFKQNGLLAHIIYRLPNENVFVVIFRYKNIEYTDGTRFKGSIADTLHMIVNSKQPGVMCNVALEHLHPP
jgi:hypothetical protein